MRILVVRLWKRWEVLGSLELTHQKNMEEQNLIRLQRALLQRVLALVALHLLGVHLEFRLESEV